MKQGLGQKSLGLVDLVREQPRVQFGLFALDTGRPC